MNSENLDDRQKRIMKDILWTIANKDILPENESFLLNSVEGRLQLVNHIDTYINSNVLMLTNNHTKESDADSHLTILLIKDRTKLLNTLTELVSALLKGDIKFKIEEFVFPVTISFYDESGEKYHLIDYGKGTIEV